MLFAEKPATAIRADFRKALQSGKLLRFPGAAQPIVALEIARHGFEGIYISGAGLAADLGLPDIGLTTLNEVAGRGHQIARVTDLPTIIDIDTGFGEPMNVARTIQELEEAGIAGCHLEDQMNPKRCGHLDNKVLVEPSEMVRKIKAAVQGRRDPNFIVIARTDARGVEGMDAAIDRAKAYADAGADVIFPEAMADAGEFETFRRAIDLPMLANITEFGKSPLMTVQQLSDIGYNIAIYPAGALRLAMKTITEGLEVLKSEGTLESLLGRMQTRGELYELLRYEDYNMFDQDIFNFKV